MLDQTSYCTITKIEGGCHLSVIEPERRGPERRGAGEPERRGPERRGAGEPERRGPERRGAGGPERGAGESAGAARPSQLRRRGPGVIAAQLSIGLSRELWLVQAGIFLNMLGYGAVLPFEIIYLHDGRGFGLGVAGLVVGTITGVAVVAAPLAGSLIDRYGARVTAGCAGFALAALAGAGNGALNPSQSTLLATLGPRDKRHRATAVSRVAGNAGIGIGGAI